MFTGVPSPFPPLVSPRFFLRENFSRALLSERLEQAKLQDMLILFCILQTMYKIFIREVSIYVVVKS